VTVAGEVVGSFPGLGLVLLVGVTHTDTPTEAAALATRIYGPRIFEGAEPGEGPREVSARDGNLPVLVVSQFTLYGSTRKGRRPTWDRAAPGPIAEPLVGVFVEALRAEGAPVNTG
jgi:D-tyrosyl-tRNA(Tyr) deacylase